VRSKIAKNDLATVQKDRKPTVRYEPVEIIKRYKSATKRRKLNV
jgi:hypothetical protein